MSSARATSRFEIRVTLSMPSPPAGPVPVRISLRMSSRFFERDDLGDHAAQREPEDVDLVEPERPDERDGVVRHCLDRVGHRAGGGADASVVEGDHAVLRGDAVDDAWVPVVEVRRQVREKDHRRTRLWAELAVGELHAPGRDGAGRGVLVRRGEVGLGVRVVVHDCSAISVSHWAWSAGYSAVRSFGQCRFHHLAGRIGEDLLGVACDSGHDLLRNGLRADLLPAHTGSHVGVDEAGVHRDDEGSLPSELDAERVRERPRGRLRRAVRRPLRHRDERQHGQHVDQGAATVVPKDRREGARDAHRTEVVRLHLGPSGLDAAVCQRCGLAEDACVVDDDGDVSAGARGIRDVVVVRHVEPNGDEAVVRDARRVPSAAVHGGTGVEQGLRDRGAETAIGAGDQGSCAFDLHG